MKSVRLNDQVVILDKPNGRPRNDVVWTVWSQAPGGWWLFRRNNGATEWEEQPARMIAPAPKHLRSSA